MSRPNKRHSEEHDSQNTGKFLGYVSHQYSIKQFGNYFAKKPNKIM